MLRVVAICDCCEDRVDVYGAQTWNAGRKLIVASDGWVYLPASPVHEEAIYCVNCGKALGLLVDCPGEAHETIRNGGDQDHCGVCAPGWGVVLARPRPNRADVERKSEERYEAIYGARR